MENVYRRMILVLEWSVLVFMMKTIILEGTFIKYYKISQLIHTQSIAN